MSRRCRECGFSPGWFLAYTIVVFLYVIASAALIVYLEASR